MPITFATSFGPLGVVLLFGATAPAQNTPEETKKPLSKEIERHVSNYGDHDCHLHPVGLINAGPAIGGAEQILFALISALPVSQPRSNVWKGSKVTIGNDTCAGFSGVVPPQNALSAML